MAIMTAITLLAFAIVVPLIVEIAGALARGRQRRLMERAIQRAFPDAKAIYFQVASTRTGVSFAQLSLSNSGIY